jgi:hypothetical protein
VAGGAEQILSIGASWDDLAAEHTRRAELSALALGDHTRSVVPTDTKAAELASDARDAEKRRERLVQRAQRLSATAQAAAAALLNQLRHWDGSKSQLVAGRGGGQPDQNEAQGNAEDNTSRTTDADGTDGGWGPVEVDELRSAEPSQVLAVADAWAAHVMQRSATLAATSRSRATALTNESKALREQADRLRRAADELRAGKLLPLPRPSWARESNDAEAFGAALTWSPGFNDEAAQAAVEVALADSGLLGATLTTAGARTSTWNVNATGPQVTPNLSAALAADPSHPLRAEAEAILQRVALVDRAGTAASTLAALIIGRDGSFRAGPLLGDRLAETDGSASRSTASPASYVGERQRRAAALARAELLDRDADALDGQAAELSAQARDAQSAARAIEIAAGSFPQRDALRRAEASRAEAAGEAERARTTAEELAAKAKAAKRKSEQAHQEWSERTRNAGLPPDPINLGEFLLAAQEGAKALTSCARILRGKLVGRVRTVLQDVEDDARAANDLTRLQGLARVAHDAAIATEEEIKVLMQTSGSDIQAVLAQVVAAEAEVKKLDEQMPGFEEALKEANRTEAALAERLRQDEERLSELAASATAAIVDLRGLLRVPGVLAALTSTPADSDVPGPDAAEGAATPEVLVAEAETLLAQTEQMLAGRKIVSRRTLQERYDTARAKLARIWTLDFGDAHGRMETFVLTHNDTVYNPVTAALRGQYLARQAEAALHVADEEALRTFIIDRLPAAIGVAWTHLHDWRREVNAKMKTATASSGVGVQVEITPARDMSPAVRTVYELACKTGTPDRSDEQRTMLGRAIRSLIEAADGDKMIDRVEAAIDVRDWVHVTYVVTRPGQNAKPWTSRTGLSGGERRLVVLAPMLAAVAAAYDSLDPAGLRLVTLDEVPAEVDEVGREGLARYLAELDLDLVCTSYGWDGAPGAWDGIDAWDFEGDESSVIVAFPMLVRDLTGVPGDAAYLATDTPRDQAAMAEDG